MYSFLATRRDQSGSALTLVIIFSAIAGVLAAAMSSQLLSMLRVNEVHGIKERLSEHIANFSTCISDGPSWASTVADTGNPAAIRCMTSPSGCTNGARAKIRLSLKSPEPGGGHFCVPGYDPLKPTAGFSRVGEVCDTYSAAGSDTCPYRIELNWRAHCISGAATCADPIEIVVGTVSFAPGSGGGIAPKVGDGMVRADFPNQQTFAVLRGVGGEYAPVILSEARPAGEFVGACIKGEWIRRRMSRVDSDLGFYSQINPDGSFRLAQGTYICRISVPGYLVGGHIARLRNYSEGGRILIWGSSEYSPEAIGYAQSRSVGYGQFTLNAAGNLGLEHICTNRPIDPAIHDLSLGVPSGAALPIAPAPQEVYSVVSCTRLEEG
jgi:hypothetical protein